MHSTSSTAPKASGKPFGFGGLVESFGNTHPKGSHLKKMTHPLSIADLPVYIWLRATRISVVSAHSFADYADKD